MESEMLDVAKSPHNRAGALHLQAVVTGITPAPVVEFTFVYGDPDLSVELVLPLAAFREFCSENGAIIVVPDDRLRASVRRLVAPIPVISTVQTEPSA